MGAGLFERYAAEIAEADRVLGYSVAELCLADPRNVLGSTRYAQPALYVVNALHWWQRRDAGEPPARFLAGHSLGEYTRCWPPGASTSPPASPSSPGAAS